MLNVTISLKYSSDNSSKGSIEGWYLPSNNTQSWFAALSETQASLHNFRYFLAPKSLSDRQAQGLIAARIHPMERSESPASVVIPTGAISLHSHTDDISGRALLIPQCSYLYPAYAAQQLLEETANSGNTLYVWLPHCGPIGFDTEDEINLCALIRHPHNVSTDDHRNWLKPPIISSIPERISKIEFTETVRLSDLFHPMQQEIGGNTGDLLDIDESGNPSHGIRHTMRQTMRSIFKKVLQQSPEARRRAKDNLKQGNPKNPPATIHPQQAKGESNQTGSFQHLFNMLGNSLQKERDKQLEKLLRLFSKDPDKALKFSIPLNSSPSCLGRGLAPPSSKLSSWIPDFSLSGLIGGGAPFDIWDINSELRSRLMHAYREQAQRELAAGRVRRAAFIHAHLLGDLNSAARILESGKYYLEAAELYGKHLKRPRDQARCLVAAAQFMQAATIYEELDDFVAAGDLLSGIGDHSKAVDAYRRAVEILLQQRKVLEAATLLDEKLDNRAEAYALLWNQWPYGSQSMEAAIQAFTWLNQEERHDEALTRLKAILNTSSSAKRLDLLNLLLHLYKSYTYAPLKTVAEDQCRLLAIADDSTTSTVDMTARLNILRQLHSNDAFLHRDLRRFIDRHRSKFITQSKETQSYKRGTLRKLAAFNLPASLMDAAMFGNEILLFCSQHGRLLFYRLSLHDNGYRSTASTQLLTFPDNTNPTVGSYSNLAASPNTLHLSFFGDRHLTFKDYSSNSSKTATALNLKSPRNPDLLVGAVADSGTHWYLTRGNGLLTAESKSNLSTFDVFDTIEPLISSLDVPLHSFFLNPNFIHLTTVNSIPYLAVGNILLAVQGSKLEVVLVSDAPITSLTSSLPHTLHRLLICTVNSLSVLHLPDNNHEYLSRSNHYLQAIFLQGGRIAAITENEIELYERTQTSTVLRDSDSIRSNGTCRLLPLSIDTIGLLHHNGALHRWRHT